MYKMNRRHLWVVLLAAVIAAGGTGCVKTAVKEPVAKENVSEPEESAGKDETKEAAEAKPENTAYAGEDGQYIVPAMYPEDLLKWDPGEAGADDHLSWCASVIPLAERVNLEELPSLHDGKSEEARVMAVSIMNSGTSGNPAQGSSEFMGRANMFSYWQYIDTLVYWGGSAGEGIIVPPGPDVTDAGHKNGVKVLGTVFFPQEVHGGKIEWVREMTAKAEDGTYPAADQLIKLAQTLKFDGWFINQETEGTNREDAETMREMISYLKEKAPELSVVWYDSMTESGEIDWQNALNEKNRMYMSGAEGKTAADSMFLNFWWTTDKLEKETLLEKSSRFAAQQKIDPYQLYAGVDVQAGGVETPVKWKLFSNSEGAPFTSLGLYCPSWTYYSADGDAGLFQEREQSLWVNSQGDPGIRNTVQGGENAEDWLGISSFKKEQSVLTKTPFVTDFSMGHGLAWYRDGEKVSDGEWNNRSIQDIMPSYRFSLKGEIESPEGAVDYEEAWNGGNCIRFSGKLEAGKTAEAELFAAGFKLEPDTVVSTVIKSNVPTELSLRLEFTDGEETVIKGDQPAGEEWTKTKYDLSGLEGKHVSKISLLLTAAKEGQAVWKLGHLDVLTGAEDQNTVASETVSAQVQGVYSKDGIHAGVRVRLGEQRDDISRYEIYEEIGDREVFIKASVNASTYLEGITRQGKETESEFKVIAVNPKGERREAGSFVVKWGEYPKPSADFTVNQTLVRPGEEIRLQSLASETTEEIFWNLEGAVTEESQEKNPTVVYEKEGTYTISMTAKNSSGEDTAVRENLIVVSNKADQAAEIAGGKSAEVSGFTNDNEVGKFALDGDVSTKWCAVGEEPHKITIDLGAEYLIGKVEIAHAQAGGEGRDYNTKAFTILAGTKEDSLKEAAVVKDNTEAVSQTAFAPVKARYVSVSIDKATQGGDTAARIYEIKVYGITE